jgi:hypothetical protein
LIEGNVSENTGFLLWISSSCFSCVFHRLSKGKIQYFICALDENKAQHTFQTITDIFSLMQTVCDLVTEKYSNEVQYEIQFVACSTSQLSNTKRQSIIRRHQSVNKKKENAKKQRVNYVAMETEKKRLRLQNMADYSKRKDTYNTMDPKRKQDPFFPKVRKISIVGSSKNTRHLVL